MTISFYRTTKASLENDLNQILSLVDLYNKNAASIGEDKISVIRSTKNKKRGGLFFNKKKENKFDFLDNKSFSSEEAAINYLKSLGFISLRPEKYHCKEWYNGTTVVNIELNLQDVLHSYVLKVV